MKTRSRAEQSDATVQRILDAAMQVFAEEGFGGARVDEIARRAKANKATIYYHIGGKEDLYAEVLQITFEGAIERVTKALQNLQSPEEKLKAYIRSFTQLIQGHRYLPAIMMRELASGSRHLPETVVQELVKIMGIVTSILKEGEEQGVFVHVNPILVHLMITGTNILSRTALAISGRHRKIIPEETIVSYHGLLEHSPEELETLILRAIKKEK